MRKNKLKKQYVKKIKENYEKKHISQFNLSENNRITYVYKDDLKTSKTEIVCVSLEIKILDDWVTILYYDNHHEGLLHRHKKIAYKNEADIVDYEGVKKKGDWKKLMNWAIEDIKNNYRYHKKKFLRRNRLLLKDIMVEEY